MWSPQQDQALKAISDWYRSGEQVFRLFGYAGTGKTTLAKEIATSIGGSVMFGAFTGKAAHVLSTKGCSPSSTIHSMIYIPTFGRERSPLEQRLEELLEEIIYVEEEEKQLALQTEIEKIQKELQEHPEKRGKNKVLFELNQESPVAGASLIIIDECSMVNEEMAMDLLSFGTKVLVLGDPAQLPPVFGTGYFTDAEPNFMLTEVHRQAKDNPIIALATSARNGELPKRGSYGSSRVVGLEALQRDDLREVMLTADQILVGRNKTRRGFNDRIRALRGYEGSYPNPGERIICLKNNHEIGIFNGSIWHVEHVQPPNENDVLTFALSNEAGEPFRSADGEYVPVNAYASLFTSETVAFADREINQFTYGYAITTHKSQGSQWDNVALWNEAGVFRDDRWKWLYTGITRAAKQLTLVYPG